MAPKEPEKEKGLETLLDLDGEIFPMANGYWVKFEAKTVPLSEQIPHGVKYSLTLHNHYNERVIGFDNAHGIKPGKRKFQAIRSTWDHKHQRNLVTDYEFSSPAKLLEDFWKEVSSVLDN